MSDTGQKVDPTESVRTLTSAPFKERNLTIREHQDTDRHYIGDALPMPSDSQVKSIGSGPAAGVSPFPARVDHTHEVGTVWSYYTSPAMTVAPGSVFINNLTYSGWGRNSLVSGQVVAFPVKGLYFIQVEYLISRVGGGLFVNESNFVLTYNNGSSGKTVLRQSNFDLPLNMVVTITDYAIAQTAPSTNDNIQLCIQHNDSANWSVQVQQLFISKVSSLTSA